MHRARTVKQAEVQQSPLLQEILQRAKGGSPSVLSFEGITVAVVPVDDITHTFSEAELRDFLLGWAEAEDTNELLTKEEAVSLARSRWGLIFGFAIRLDRTSWDPNHDWLKTRIAREGQQRPYSLYRDALRR